MKRLALLLVLALPAYAVTLSQWAAGTTIVVNVIELPATIAKAKALWRKVHPKKQKPVEFSQNSNTSPNDEKIPDASQNSGTPCPLEKERK